MIQNQEHAYVFLTWLGRCQTLGARWMGSSYSKGRAKSHDVFYCTSSKFLSKHTFLSTYYPEWLSQHMTSVSDKSKDWVQIVLDFRTNNNIKYVKINFTLPVIIDAKSAKFVSQSWNKTWTQHMKHIANHFSAGLFLSKNTHDHRANHSCENSSGGWVN